jgi:hypothetical protein
LRELACQFFAEVFPDNVEAERERKAIQSFPQFTEVSWRTLAPGT